MYVLNSYRLQSEAKFNDAAWDFFESIDFNRVIASTHATERIEQRNVNFNKLSANKFRKAHIWCAKFKDDGTLFSIGTRFPYDKKHDLCLVFGKSGHRAVLVTAWIVDKKA